MKVLDLTDSSTWPSEIHTHLDKNYKLYLGWESEIDKPSATAYDAAVNELTMLLRSSGYTLRGYHCTRLTEIEIQSILASGMLLPNLALLHKRIADVAASEMLEASIFQRLMDENQADEKNRADRIWFCFYPPYIAGQSGIERFFRSWGGEALYNSHERDPITGSALARIGVPCIIEALVAIESLRRYSSLETILVRRFLLSRGFETEENLNYEGCAVNPIPATNIIRVVKFPDAGFISLTRCNEWKTLLDLSV